MCAHYIIAGTPRDTQRRLSIVVRCSVGDKHGGGRVQARDRGRPRRSWLPPGPGRPCSSGGPGNAAVGAAPASKAGVATIAAPFDEGDELVGAGRSAGGACLQNPLPEEVAPSLRASAAAASRPPGQERAAEAARAAESSASKTASATRGRAARGRIGRAAAGSPGPAWANWSGNTRAGLEAPSTGPATGSSSDDPSNNADALAMFDEDAAGTSPSHAEASSGDAANSGDPGALRNMAAWQIITEGGWHTASLADI